MEIWKCDVIIRKSNKGVIVIFKREAGSKATLYEWLLEGWRKMLRKNKEVEYTLSMPYE